MSAPTTMWTLMYHIKKEIVPRVHEILDEWRTKAAAIPNEELRRHALNSINENTFHSEGGGVYALLTRKEVRDDLLRFIVAYQIICDYLDSLCDETESFDRNDFRSLHEALRLALSPQEKTYSYYEHHQESKDNGFLQELVEACQQHVSTFPGFSNARASMEELSLHYRNLQVYKHVKKEDREPLLTDWFKEERQNVPDIFWYEFSASTGSTLGIYALASYASRSHLAEWQAETIKDSYFPYVQGMHILLDYFIDQEEDIRDDELNFCTYYPDEETMVRRMELFKQEGEKRLKRLPDAAFHSLLNKGIIAIYLADEKVQKRPELKKTANRFIRFGGIPTAFFYLNSWVFRKTT